MSQCRHDVEQDCPACMQEEIDDLTKANQLLQAFIGNRDKEIDRLRMELLAEKEESASYHKFWIEARAEAKCLTSALSQAHQLVEK